GRLCPGGEGDRTRDQRKLEVTLPKRTRGRHGISPFCCRCHLGHLPRLRTTLLGEAQVGAGQSVEARLWHCPGESRIRSAEEGAQAHRGPGRDAASHSRQEGQGSGGKAGGTTKRESKKDRLIFVRAISGTILV